MSAGSNQDNVDKKPEDQKDEFVPKKAYLDVSNDMHKFKSENKDLSAKLAQFEAERNAREKEALAEQGRWKELYEKANSKLDEVSKVRESERNKFLDVHKKNAALSAIGGFKKDDYISFIRSEAIQMDEAGNIDQDSLSQEVERIRQTYPELLKTSSNSTLPSSAPKSSDPVNKPFNQMTESERNELKRRLLTEKLK